MFTKAKQLVSHLIFGSLGILIVVCWFLWISGYHVGTSLITNNWITHTSARYNFSVDYPSRWRKLVSSEQGFHGNRYERLRFGKPHFFVSPFAVITIERKVYANANLDNALDWGEGLIHAQDKNFPSGMELFSNSDEMIYKRDFIYVYSGQSYKVSEVYILRDTDVILFCLVTHRATHNEFVDDLEKMVNSFQTLP